MTRRPCEVCGRDMWAKRSDARTCSARCRQALSRAERARTTTEDKEQHDG